MPSTTQAGDKRRREIVQRAMHLASVNGLEGITIGGVAADLRISKSSLQVLFGTKEALQLAIVAAAREIYDDRVIRPAERAADGLPRLRAFFDHWIDYLDTFEGGCFFIAAAHEVDDREGPVHDVIVDITSTILAVLRQQAGLAVRLGELDRDTDTDQLIFELHGLVLAANLTRQLLRSADACQRARDGVRRRLDLAAVPGRPG